MCIDIYMITYKCVCVSAIMHTCISVSTYLRMYIICANKILNIFNLDTVYMHIHVYIYNYILLRRQNQLLMLGTKI